jgi:hypothetical protein
MYRALHCSAEHVPAGQEQTLNYAAELLLLKRATVCVQDAINELTACLKLPREDKPWSM